MEPKEISLISLTVVIMRSHPTIYINTTHVKPLYTIIHPFYSFKTFPKMAQFVLLFLILTHTFLILEATSSRLEPELVDPPALSPSNHKSVQIAETPKSRKLGKHYVSKPQPPTIAPSSDHDENGENAKEENDMYLEKQHTHHHGSGSVDKSIAGGGVILGGLAMAFVVSIACYIRATRRKSMVEPPTPTTARSGSS